MKAKFIDGRDGLLALELLPDTDEERLLTKQLSRQAAKCGHRLLIQGWSHDAAPGLRAIRLHLDYPHSETSETTP